MSLHGLYAITDETLTPYHTIGEQVKAALEGGAKILQFRDKNGSPEERLRIATLLRELCKGHNALFLINDDVELAAKVDADGVHVGMDDTPLEEVKKALPGKIVGVSCYGDVLRAVEAEAAGADYVAFGSCFPSPTKPKAPVIDLAILTEARKLVKAPICVIGGITLENLKELAPYRPEMAAVIGGLWKCDDVEERARQWAEALAW